MDSEIPDRKTPATDSGIEFSLEVDDSGEIAFVLEQLARRLRLFRRVRGSFTFSEPRPRSTR